MYFFRFTIISCTRSANIYIYIYIINGFINILCELIKFHVLHLNRTSKWLQRSNAHMIIMIYVSQKELNVLQTDKQTNHCTSCLFSCLCVSNRQQLSTLLYMPSSSSGEAPLMRSWRKDVQSPSCPRLYAILQNMFSLTYLSTCTYDGYKG
jgi:hypothetical protein